MDLLRSIFSDRNPLRLFYHKISAVLAALVFGFPARNLRVVAVTGTNGKTSTCNILHKIFTEAGHKCGMLTTVNIKIGEFEEPNLHKQSTLSPWLLQAKLKEMIAVGCKVAVLEVTSHAMTQSRLWGINVDTAVFTNLTQDHLLYHGSMEAYRDAKGMLFRHLNASFRKPHIPKISVVNQDDPETAYYNSFPADQKFEYGINKGIYRASEIVLRANSTSFLVNVPNGEYKVDWKIPGRMNVYNALAAIAVASAHNIRMETVKLALESMKSVPGRLESIDEGQNFSIVVDYAHSEDSLDQLLALFKELTKGRLILVFGATGGGRDQVKRPKMGAIAHKYADMIILTDDDPYEEDSHLIARQVRGGIPREEGDRFWQILNRKEAIRLALAVARENDTVVIAGKGAEAFQVIGKNRVPHDDREVVRSILSEATYIQLPASG